jgi:hypothetical protein
MANNILTGSSTIKDIIIMARSKNEIGFSFIMSVFLKLLYFIVLIISKPDTRTSTNIVKCWESKKSIGLFNIKSTGCFIKEENNAFCLHPVLQMDSHKVRL